MNIPATEQVYSEHTSSRTGLCWTYQQ